MGRPRYRLGFVGLLCAGAGALLLAAVCGTALAQGESGSAHTVAINVPLANPQAVRVTDQMLMNAGRDGANWVIHGANYSNQRFSELRQVDDRNVRRLAPVAIVQTGMTASFETTPLVINGVMYITTPMVNGYMKIMALDAKTGITVWSHAHRLGSMKFCCGPVNRGVAAAYGKLYLGTLDAKLVAIDAADGKMLWEQQVAEPMAGYSETMTPQVYKGMVIVGSSGGEWPIRGFVAAYDANSGRPIWRWNSTNPASWSGESWKSGGGMVWTTPAIDPQQDLVIFAVGNPNPDMDGSVRQGDNLYTDSIVALHASNGELAWYYQEVPHDVWDYDAVSNVVLFDVNDRGRRIPAAGEAGKTGFFYIVDRRNGQLIRKSQPFVIQSKNFMMPPTKTGVDILPGANGGSEWSPPAFSPLTHMVYVLGMDQLMTFTTVTSPFVPGHMKLGSAFFNASGTKSIQDGTFTAINVDNGRVAWQYHAPEPMIGGALATAGNLVFTGEGDGSFDAFNARTGAMLWRFYLGAGVNAPPVTYAVAGKQYVAVAAGGSFQLAYAYGDTVAIFALK